MRRRMLMLVLPIITLVVLAGASLGMWFFGPLSAQSQTGTGVDVAGLSNCGKVTIPNRENIKVIFNQRGISLNQQIEVEFKYEGPASDLDVIHQKIEFNFDLYVPVELDKYVNVNSVHLVKDAQPNNHYINGLGYMNSYRYHGEWNPSRITPSTPTADFTFTSDLFLSYKPGMVPKTQQEVEALLNLIGKDPTNPKFTINARFEARPKGL